MIGKITIGKSFGGCLKYCLNDKRLTLPNEPIIKDRAEVLLYNKCYGDQNELIRQFNEVRQLNPKLAKPVLHITLSLAPGEKLSKDKLMEMCQDCAREMGFENNQYIAVHHNDTDHQHIHIVANRIGFDKRTVSDSNSFSKIAKYCRKMELKHELKQVLSPRLFLSKEQRLLPRWDSRKEQLKKHIQQTLQEAGNYNQFEQKMKSLGYQVLKGRGIAFIDKKKVRIKGSEVGLSLQKIEKILSLKHQLEIKKSVEKIRKEALQKKPGIIPLTARQRIIKQTRENGLIDSSVAEIEKQISSLINDLMKPEFTDNSINPELIKEAHRHKRKHRHRH